MGLDGKSYAIDRSIRLSIAERMLPYDSCCNAGMTSTLEMGRGYGFSTTFLLAAPEAGAAVVTWRLIRISAVTGTALVNAM